MVRDIVPVVSHAHDHPPLPRTLREMVAVHAAATPDAPALLSPDRPTLTYAALLRQIDAVIEVLNAAGIGREDPVALVLPHGPEIAVAAYAVACCATAAPINPMYRIAELEFALEDLCVRALFVEAGSENAATAVARARGIPIFELARRAAAGAFDLVAPATGKAPAARGGPAAPGDVALVLHTSGTTGRPKIVPLTHTNLAASVEAMVKAFDFTAADRCLSLLPLFHIALLSNVIIPFATGGSTICTEGLAAPSRFGEIFTTAKPTWYVGVPALHSALRAQVARTPEILERHSFRFIASGAMSLSSREAEEIEAELRAPVVGGYGLTESAGLATASPLPPGRRKHGSVGVSIGSELAIVDETGRPLPAGQRGEVVLRGPNVMSGYRDQPEANADAFFGNWLRTGDLGHLDEDGYLWISGRLKEVINRGGEKITPYEIDLALLSHPQVTQAVTFAVADDRLGEEVAAAVVVHPGATPTEADLRAHVAARLAHFKVPRRIAVVAALPVGPTGKVSRFGLLDKLGLPPAWLTEAEEVPFVAPRNAIERSLARLFAELLGVESVGVHDDFFAAGGDSLSAVTLFHQIEDELGHTLPVMTLFDRCTVAALAEEISRGAARGRSLVPIRPTGRGAPLICLHGLWGDVFYFRRVAAHLDWQGPVLGFRMRGLDGSQPLPASVQEMAEEYAAELLAFDPRGPYRLAGYSFGGLIAYEMACRLAARGGEVAFLGMIDTINPAIERPQLSLSYLRFLAGHARRLGLGALAPVRFRRQMRLRMAPRAPVEVDAATAPAERYRLIEATLEGIARRYRPPHYSGRALLLRTAESAAKARDAGLGWKRRVGAVQVVEVPGLHMQLMESPWVERVAAELDRGLGSVA